MTIVIIYCVILVNGVVGCTTTIRTRGDGCRTGTGSSTGMRSIVRSHLLMVDFFLSFGLGHGVLPDQVGKL